MCNVSYRQERKLAIFTISKTGLGLECQIFNAEIVKKKNCTIWLHNALTQFPWGTRLGINTIVVIFLCCNLNTNVNNELQKLRNLGGNFKAC